MATLSSASRQTEPNTIATQTSEKLLTEGQWLGLFLIGHVLLAVIYSLVLPAGSHVIELTYRPTSVIVGAIISLLTLVLVLILITTLFFLRRYASDTEQTLSHEQV